MNGRRCAFRHPLFLNYRAENSWHCDGTDQCWVPEIGKLEKGGDEYYCPFHNPDYKAETPDHMRGHLLQGLLRLWSDEEVQSDKFPTFALPALNCDLVDLDDFEAPGSIDFSYATFTSVFVMHDADLKGIKFNNASFSGPTNFHSTIFREWSDFSYSSFEFGVYFQSVQFRRVADFRNARFQNHSDFSNAEFVGGANFSNA